MPSLSLDLKQNSKLHKRIVEAVRDRIEFSKAQYKNRYEKWKENEDAALAYLPERDIDATRRLERSEGGKPQYTTVAIPYSYGVLMASHTYWTTVFLSRVPVLQFAGRHGETEQKTQALEAMIDYQVNVGGMLVPMNIWLLDVGKYGLGVIGTYWDEEINTISEIIEIDVSQLGIKTGKKKKQKVTKTVPGYIGNRLYNVRPFDFFPDPRLPVARFQEGEYCGSYFELGWSTILQRRDAGYYVNIDEVKRHNTRDRSREQGSSQLNIPDNDPYAEIGARKVGEVIQGYECTINLIPSQWGLGKGDSMEKWVFTVTSDYQICFGAQPVNANHNRFPYHVCELEPEGYALANRGIPEITKPIADTMDWLLNSHMYNVRKTLNNQFVVDPSRVVMKDVNAPGAGGVIRAKPAAYGSDMRNAIYQLPVTDVTRGHLVDMQVMLELGQRATGVNDQILGMISSTGRKTATEVRTSSTFGVNRLKTAGEYMSSMGWAPMSQMLVQNSQQFFSGERKFKLVGDLIEQAGPTFVDVDEEAISGFYDYVAIDGSLPVDRFAQANLWREMFAQMRNLPEIGQQYDIAKIFAWVAQLAGLKNINQFKIQVQPDEVLQEQARAGNLVPLGQPAGNGGPSPEIIPQGKQISNLGPVA